MGTVFQHFVKLPGFEKSPAGFVGLCCLVLPFAGLAESVYWKDDDLSKEPGNFGDPANWAELFGPFGGYTEENRNKELNNGRMAMISILGIVVAELATGKDGIQQF